CWPGVLSAPRAGFSRPPSGFQTPQRWRRGSDAWSVTGTSR
ncbi:MAG: hypothetical protein AVDCRST_MAG61-2223, partial [uncultured Friedmanniella sp.]